MAKNYSNTQGRLLSLFFAALLMLYLSTAAEGRLCHRIRDFFFPKRTCRTKECGEAAQTIMDNQNSTVKPCEDFYEFSCGNWIAAHPVPENDIVSSQFNEIEVRVQERVREILEKADAEDDLNSIKKARELYRACLHTDNHAEDNMKVLLDRLAVWGGWPIATVNWDESKFDWQKLLVNLNLKNDVHPLLSIGVTIDRRNSSKIVILIDQGGIKFCIDHVIRKNELPLLNWITKLATKIAKAANQSVTEDDIMADARDLLRLEADLCRARESLEARQNTSRMYNPKSLKELQDFTDSDSRHSERSKVDWVNLLKNLLESGENVSEEYQVIVAEPEYILKMLSIIDKTTPRTIANYMLWQKLTQLYNQISEEFRRIGNDYVEDTTGVTGAQVRWKTCVEYTTDVMEHAIGYKYVKLHFSEDEKKIAQELVNHILESFKEDLKEIDWMDYETRSLAVEKAENMVVAVGYPDWYNSTNIEEFYKEYVVGNSHIINMEKLNLVKNSEAIKLLKEPHDRTQIYVRPTHVNAYYGQGANAILIPAGIFQEPIYVKGRPEAMNYGAIGTIIGHEISHAFDDQGRSEDKFGNFAQWWDDTTLNTYLLKKRCVEEQYGEYPIPEIKTDEYKITNLDGLGTVSENIADDGGVKQAFKAYKRYVDEHGSEKRLPGLEDYTPEQLFFIGFATLWCESNTPEYIFRLVHTDTHTPSKYRVLITMNNMEEFSKAWKCKERSDIKKCSFW